MQRAMDASYAPAENRGAPMQARINYQIQGWGCPIVRSRSYVIVFVFILYLTYSNSPVFSPLKLVFSLASMFIYLTCAVSCIPRHAYAAFSWNSAGSMPLHTSTCTSANARRATPKPCLDGYIPLLFLCMCLSLVRPLRRLPPLLIHSLHLLVI